MVIMDNKDSLDIGTCHHWNRGFRKHKGFFLSFRHVRKDETIFFRKEYLHGSNERITTIFSNANNLQSLGLMRIVEAEPEDMTGERSRKEPVGEVQKWKNKGKVWKELEKGGVANFFEKLHGSDPEITNSMVNSWNKGKVKVNGVYFQITEEVVAEVTGMPMEGHKFFRDKKLSSNAIKDFVKNTKELNKLVKKESFFVTETIKKLWRYVLYSIIDYITLDPRFDRVRTHHFVILNHFRHGIKISFSFYLFNSMDKAISSFKKKATVNLALHEGLLLLIHEHFHAQTISKNPNQGEEADKSSSSFSSDSDDVESISSDEIFEYTGKKTKSHQMVPSTTKTPSRKSPRGQTPAKAVSAVVEEEMDTDDSNKVSEEEPDEEKPGKRQKREGESMERFSSQGKEAPPLPLSPVLPQPLTEENDNLGQMGEVQVKNRRKAWKNFNVRTATMGIYREAMNPQILVDDLEQPRLNESIDPAIVAISDNARESGMNLLNNARSSMIDNFRSIKWLFHELEDVRDRVSQMEKTKKKIGDDSQGDRNSWETLMERRVKNIENYNHNTASQIISLLASINDNILSLSGNLIDRNQLEEEDDQNRDKVRLDEDKAEDSTLEQDLANVQEHKAEEQQKCAEAAQTMLEMEK